MQAIDGILFRFHRRHKSLAVEISVGRQDAVKVVQLGVVGEAGITNSPFVVVHRHGLVGQDIHDFVGRVFEQARVGGLRGKVQVPVV